MKLKEILTGNISKRELGYIYFPTLFCVVVLWAIARALYPSGDGYFINDYHISRQGNFVLNPVGAWFFIVGTAITGLLLIPYIMFIYQKLKPTLKIVNIFMALCGIIGGIGLTLVGIAPEGSNEIILNIHSTGSTMAFSGLGVATFFSVIIMFMRIIQKRPWPTMAQFANLFFIILFFALIFLVSDDSVNQWAGFFIVFAWCTGMYFIVPDESHKNELEKELE